MKNWLSRQNSFTQLTAVGTAVSAATGMAALATLIVAFIAAFVVGQQTILGIVYPSVLDKIAKVALYGMGLSIVGFLISAAGLIASMFVGTKTGPDRCKINNPAPAPRLRPEGAGRAMISKTSSHHRRRW